MTLHDLITIPHFLYSKIDFILYGDVTVFAGCPREFMMCCPLMLARDANLEDLDAVIAWLIVLLQMTVVYSGTAASIDLKIADLVELQSESIGVDVNTLLVKREC